MTMEQLEFLPPKPLKPRFKRVGLNEVVGDREAELVGPRGSKAFAESIEKMGVTTPIQLEAMPDGRYKIIEGRRRLRELMELTKRQPRNPLWKTVPAMIFEPGGWSPEVLGVHANEHRGDNTALLLQTVEHLIDKGLSEPEIVSLLGVPVQRLRRVLRLRALAPTLRLALDGDKISQKVAEEAAKLPEAIQARLVAIYEEKGELSEPMLKEARHARQAEAIQTTLAPEGEADPLLPEAPAEDTPSWQRLLASKIEECMKIAASYGEVEVKSHLYIARESLLARAARPEGEEAG